MNGKLFFVLVFATLFSSVKSLSGQVDKVDLVKLSTDLLMAVKEGNSTDQLVREIGQTPFATFESQLDNDNRKKAFWMNVYNAFVQISLMADSTKFNNRGKFFSDKQFMVAGESISLDKIEHGIIRGSRSKLTLGLTKKIFVNKFEKKLRVKQRDGRIHFALNCGAKSCPPVAIYEPSRIDEQLDQSSQLYLNNQSKYDGAEGRVFVPVLFSWFRGDFGGFKGVKKKYLIPYEIIPKDANPKLKFNNYDWSLSLGNFIEL